MKLRTLGVSLGGAGCLLLIAASGCGQAGARAEDPVDAQATSSIERVTAAQPKRKTLRVETTQPAWIEAFEQTPLYAKVPGYVHKVHVDIGDLIKKDQPLVTLSTPELGDDVAERDALVAQAEAEVQQAECNVAAWQAAAQSAQAKIAEAQANTGRTTSEYDRSTAEYERIKKLADSGSVTDKLVDEMRNQRRAAEAGRDSADAAVQSADAAAKEAEAKVRKAKADGVAASARLRVAKADLARAKTMLGYAEIKAPFDGVVTGRAVDTGHFVQPATGAGKPLLVVARRDKVRVFMDVPELESALVDVGDLVTLRVQAFSGKELHASVTRTSWSLDNSNRSLRTEVDMPNDHSTLRPGMYATATILLDRRDNAVVLPATAIVREGGQAYCWCVESGKAVRRSIALGLRSGQEVEVLSGIDATSTVVVAQAESLQQGQAVKVIAPKE